MELRHIRYFLAVAEEGNFTRAAARVGIGQPPLSLQIKDLEAEIGVQLFHRVPHGAELTEAGLAFLEQVKPIPEAAALAVRAAQRAGRGETGVFALGFTGSTALNPIVPASIREFGRAYPGVELRLTESNSGGLMAGLREGRLDAAILRPAARETEGLHIDTLAREPLVVALPSGHALAGENGLLDLARLRDEALILPPLAIGSSLRETPLAACRAAGFEPRLGQAAPQIALILSLVAAELGYALVPVCMSQLQVRGVVYREILGGDVKVTLALAYRAGRMGAMVGNFRGVAKAAARE